MNKKYRYIRGTVAVIVGILSVLAFTQMLYPLPIFDVQLTALLQRVLIDFALFTAILLAGLLIITLLFGRIYCSTLCPLGLYQELLMLLFRHKNTVQKNKPYKYFLAAIVFGALIGGTSYLVRLIDPYTLFGSALSGAWLGLAVLGVLAVLVWFKGRLFCANICPVGVLLGLISKHAVNKMYIDADKCVSCGLCASKCPTGSIDFKNKTINNETCLKCFKCMGGCRRDGIHYGIKPIAPAPFNPARRRLLIGGAVIAAFALAAKGGINLGKAVAAKIKRVIIPAGAESAEKFANRCLNCNLCVQNCPMKVLKKANSDYPAVHLDYTDSFCDYDCNKCSQVCPSGAIKRLSLAQKQKTQIGLASIDEQICVKCGLCVMKCPRQAISKADGAFPIVDFNQCIGCGACANGCPVKAITIQPVHQQKTL
jgi:ferredoxin-type protein NapF